MATLSIEELLKQLLDKGGSDLHLSTASPPRIRVDGVLLPIDAPPMTPELTRDLVYSLLASDQVARFERDWELDFSFGVEGMGRFRVNVFKQRGAVGAVFRMIPAQVMSLEKLGLPKQVTDYICEMPRGLVLVTGATGSGKSTTLASIMDYINKTRKDHVMTIEDPIEFVHENKQCLVNQREVGSDTKGFAGALRSVLRQDPDVVLIGEMRDTETIEAALTIAETGHLTFGTLHTSDCVQTINRVIDVFPSHQQAQIRTQLSFVLQVVMCQQLLPRASGRGRVMVAEIMIVNPAIRSLIRESKGHQIYSVIQTGGGMGMRTMNQSLAEQYKKGAVKFEDIMEYSGDVEDLKRMLKA